MIKNTIIQLAAWIIFSLNIAFSSQPEICPENPSILKKILETKKPMSLYDFFSKNCIIEIKEHYVNRDPDWIKIAPILDRYISISSLIRESLLADPLKTLETIHDSGFLSENLGFICDSGRVFGTVDASVHIKELNNTINRLDQLKNLPDALDKLRQSCVYYTQKEKLRLTSNKDTCPTTPKGISDLIKEDNGVSLILDSEYCKDRLFDHTRMGESSWLALAPILLKSPRTEVMTDLSTQFQNTLIHALPRNPEITLNIIAEYFPTKVDEVCYTDTITADYNIYSKDGNATWNMDIPNAIKKLNALKLKDIKLENIRDRCVVRLEYTLKTAQRQEPDTADD